MWLLDNRCVRASARGAGACARRCACVSACFCCAGAPRPQTKTTILRSVPWTVVSRRTFAQCTAPTSACRSAVSFRFVCRRRCPPHDFRGPSVEYNCVRRQKRTGLGSRTFPRATASIVDCDGPGVQRQLLPLERPITPRLRAPCVFTPPDVVEPPEEPWIRCRARRLSAYCWPSARPGPPRTSKVSRES